MPNVSPQVLVHRRMVRFDGALLRRVMRSANRKREPFAVTVRRLLEVALDFEEGKNA